MYNEKLKTQYLSSEKFSEGYKQHTIMLLDKIGAVEEELGKDLCTWNIEELQENLSGMLGVYSASRKSVLSVYVKYVKWCVNHHVKDSSLAILQFDTSDLELIRRKMVKNPLHLQYFLDYLCEPEYMETFDCTLRCYMWLGFSGVEEPDVLLIKSTDVDLKNMVVRHNDTEYPIYHESVPAFKKCLTLDSFRVLNKKYTYPIYVPRQKTDVVLRGMKSTTRNMFRLQISADKKKVDENNKFVFDIGDTVANSELTYDRVWKSGIFYRMFETELNNGRIDFTNILLNHLKYSHKDDKEGEEWEPAHEYMMRLKRAYNRDYAQWKEAFQLVKPE